MEDITLTLEEGQCYGFVGYNGCGKTMLLRAVCGYIKPDQGDVDVDGISMKDNYIKDAGIIIEKKGKTILLTSHDERNISRLCDKVYEMEEGRIYYE